MEIVRHKTNAFETKKRARPTDASGHEFAWEKHMEATSELNAENAGLLKIVFHITLARFYAMGFQRDDLRRLSTSANLAWLLYHVGLYRLSRRQYDKIATLWQKSADFRNANIQTRAHSSSFHLSMEAKYWENYRKQSIVRLDRFAENTLRALVSGHCSNAEFYKRWRGEKTPIFDDQRRILSACLLILPNPQGGAKHERT